MVGIRFSRDNTEGLANEEQRRYVFIGVQRRRLRESDGKMRVGLFLTNQQHLGTDMVSALQNQIRMVHHARDMGWDSLFSGQHYLNEGNNQQLQLVPFLTRLIPEAGEMTTGLGVLLLGLHNPVYVAETVATLDVIAGGNFVFGVGLGYREVEFEAFNVPKGTRVDRFVESLELIKRLWSEDSVSHDGDTCRLNNVTMNLKPVQQPYPPIWFAANNDRAIRRAARMGDTWFINPHSTMATIARQLNVYRDELTLCGKAFPTELPCMREIFCAKDRRTAIQMAGPYLSGKYRDYAQWGQDDAMPDDESFDKNLAELTEDRFILGSPQDCFEQLRGLHQRIDYNHLILRTDWAGMPLQVAMHSLRLISKELLPELKRLRAHGD